MNNPTSRSDRDDAWGACPQGELQSMVGRLNAQQRSQQFASAAKLSGGAALLVLLAVVSVGLLSSPASISCMECVAQFDAYNQHLTQQQLMNKTPAGEMHKHLAECEMCRTKFEANYPGLLAKSIASAGPAVAPTIRISYLAMANSVHPRR